MHVTPVREQWLVPNNLHPPIGRATCCTSPLFCSYRTGLMSLAVPGTAWELQMAAALTSPPLLIISSGSLRHCTYCHAPLIRLDISSIRHLRYTSHVRRCNASASVELSWMPRVFNENSRQKFSCPRGHHDICKWGSRGNNLQGNPNRSQKRSQIRGLYRDYLLVLFQHPYLLFPCHYHREYYFL